MFKYSYIVDQDLKYEFGEGIYLWVMLGNI